MADARGGGSGRLSRLVRVPHPGDAGTHSMVKIITAKKARPENGGSRDGVSAADNRRRWGSSDRLL
jgi:hypothetical protein